MFEISEKEFSKFRENSPFDRYDWNHLTVLSEKKRILKVPNNMLWYIVSLNIQSEYGKLWTRITPNTYVLYAGVGLPNFEVNLISIARDLALDIMLHFTCEI